MLRFDRKQQNPAKQLSFNLKINKLKTNKKTKIMVSGPITSWQIDGETGNNNRLYFLGLQKSLKMVTAAMKLKDSCSWKKSYDPPRHNIKKQRHYFANKVPSSQSCGFPEVMYGFESCTIKKAEC